MGVPRRSDDRRRYSDKELALILKLAAELEAGAHLGAGHSLAEIQQIAAEAGIDPQLVLQAAAALNAQSSHSTATLLGAPTTYRFQRSVEGELPESELGEIVGAIRHLTGEEGEVSRVLDSIEWRQESFEGAATHVAISPRRGQTLIEVTRRYANNAGWLYAAGAIVAAAVSVVAGTEIQGALALELGVIAGLWGSAYVGTRAIWRRLAKRGERRTRELIEGLTRQIREAAQQLPELADLPRAESGSEPRRQGRER